MPRNQIPSRFVEPTPQTISDLFDKVNFLLSQHATADTSTSTSTPTPTSGVIVGGGSGGGGSAPSGINDIPILTAVPSDNPTVGAPYAVNGTMVEVDGELWIYTAAPDYAWGRALTEATVANAEFLSVGGTGDVITGTTTSRYAVLVPGFVIRIVPALSNTTAVTLAVNGITPAAVTKNGTTALTGGELQAGRTYFLLWDGTQFQIIGTALPISALLVGSDASGNPTIAALASGKIYVGSAGNLPVEQALSGDATLALTGALTLATVNGSPGTFGDATHVVQVTVNGKGLATAVSAVAITFPSAFASLRLTPSTVATLPATPGAGTLASVSDALVPVAGSPVAAGGAAFAAVCWNGSQWTVFSV